MNNLNFRLYKNLLEGSNKAVLFVQSGQMSYYDEAGATGELELYNELENELTKENIGSVKFDFQERLSMDETISYEEYKDRLYRLSEVMNCLIKELSLKEIVIVGTSLGTNLILERLSNLGELGISISAILIGVYIDEPVKIISTSIDKINIIYGSEDYIGFGEHLSIDDIIPPTQYKQTVLENIESKCKISCHIIKGVGHSLERVKKDADDPLQTLLKMI